jgi:hypothetical protein
MKDFPMSFDNFETRTLSNGIELIARIERDNNDPAPWDRECGHGKVSQWTTRAKQPGERVLVSDSRKCRYYDFAEAVRIAKRDRWDAPPYGEGTKGQRAARAAEADFNRLRRWCERDWQYVGVVVSVEQDGEEIESHASSLWGIESDCTDYLREVAEELFDEAAEIYGPDDDQEEDGSEDDPEVSIEVIPQDQADAA